MLETLTTQVVTQCSIRKRPCVAFCRYFRNLIPVLSSLHLGPWWKDVFSFRYNCFLGTNLGFAHILLVRPHKVNRLDGIGGPPPFLLPISSGTFPFTNKNNSRG